MMDVIQCPPPEQTRRRRDGEHVGPKCRYPCVKHGCIMFDAVRQGSDSYANFYSACNRYFA